MRLSETGRFAWPALAAVAVLAVLSAALWGLWAAMFSHNDQFLIERVSITGDTSALTPEEIRSVSRIREGANIFDSSAAAARRRILAASLNIEEARVRKRLPDAVDIEIVPRQPIARVVGRDCEYLHALDKDGLVFPILPRDEEKYGMLPILFDDNPPILPPGSRLRDVPGTPTEPEARLARALQVARAINEDPDCPLRITGADVSNRIYLEMQTPEGRTVRFVWEEIPDEASIRLALDTLASVLRHPGSRGKNRFDVLLTPAPKVVTSP